MLTAVQLDTHKVEMTASHVTKSVLLAKLQAVTALLVLLTTICTKMFVGPLVRKVECLKAENVYKFLIQINVLLDVLKLFCKIRPVRLSAILKLVLMITEGV